MLDHETVPVRTLNAALLLVRDHSRERLKRRSVDHILHFHRCLSCCSMHTLLSLSLLFVRRRPIPCAPGPCGCSGTHGLVAVLCTARRAAKAHPRRVLQRRRPSHLTSPPEPSIGSTPRLAQPQCRRADCLRRSAAVSSARSYSASAVVLRHLIPVFLSLSLRFTLLFNPFRAFFPKR